LKLRYAYSMDTIIVRVKMFHNLTRYLPDTAKGGAFMMPLETGTTLKELLDTLGVPEKEPKIVLINGQSQGVCTTITNNPMLNEGDTVSIFPPVAGGR